MAAISDEKPLTLNTRRIVIAGVLGAIAIVLGVTRLGFIPVPNTTGNATIMHVPAIIGAVLEGPVVGTLVGLIFGIFSFINADTPMFQNPIIAIVPRLLVGLVSWWVYRSTYKVNQDLAAALAGAAGTLTNTIGVLGLAIAFGFGSAIIPALPIIITTNAIPELILAAIITPIVVRGVNIVRSGRTTADDDTPRDKSSF
jgi:uncharacterized membrane protein